MIAIITGLFGIMIGYFFGRANTIKLCRRLYKMNVDMDMIFIEYAERDIMFNKNINECEHSIRMVK
jgi:hypothetical protein